jgi:tetratricopeptide (TPR) repeat protein
MCWVWFYRLIAVVLLLAGVNGCEPASQSQLEEEKESHFQAGKNCISSLDYAGAVDEFNRAVKVNPDSAAAHFQLGWLYEEKEPDPAAAIYHYQEFLRLRPNSDNAEVIRQHISNCKQDLAKTVLPLPVTPSMQHDFEQLAEDNKRLREEIEKWRVYAARLQAMTNPAAPPVAAPPRADPGMVAGRNSAPAPTPAAPRRPATTDHPEARPVTGKTYTVKSGDTAAAIARKHGVKLELLLAANPGLEPKRMRVGQVLTLPAP